MADTMTRAQAQLLASGYPQRFPRGTAVGPTPSGGNWYADGNGGVVSDADLRLPVASHVSEEIEGAVYTHVYTDEGWLATVKLDPDDLTSEVFSTEPELAADVGRAKAIEIISA